MPEIVCGAEKKSLIFALLELTFYHVMKALCGKHPTTQAGVKGYGAQKGSHFLSRGLRKLSCVFQSPCRSCCPVLGRPRLAPSFLAIAPN